MADRDVIDGHEGRQRHHCGEMPETAVAGQGKSDAHDVRNACSPVTIKDGGAAHPA
jgi:hypothetical protein